jgi:hypothetical protein
MRVSIYDALDRLVGQGVPLSEALRANQDVALVALAETPIRCLNWKGNGRVYRGAIKVPTAKVTKKLVKAPDFSESSAMNRRANDDMAS